MTQCDKLPASAIFHCPFVNKGEAFTKEERAKYGLSGLLPTAVSTVDQQVERMREMLNRFEKPIDKALLLDSIRDTPPNTCRSSTPRRSANTASVSAISSAIRAAFLFRSNTSATCAK